MPNRANPKIFISYAREQEQFAADLADRLLGRRKYTVYFDRFSLRIGHTWDVRIREQIEHSDLFIYLISPDSVAGNSFCHNELAVAKDKWRPPNGHVLAVMVTPTDLQLIDPYIRSATYLEPKQGDAVATTAWQADKMIGELFGDDIEQTPPPLDANDVPGGQLELDNIRSFIQRGEVRLSTMHRVAGSFVSGAGLVVLLPFLLKDATAAMIEFAAKALGSTGVSWQSLTSTWIVAFCVALYLTFLSLYFLLRDLIRFYFVPHAENQRLLFPRYAISALSYPAPMSDYTKQQILLALYSSKIYKFGMHRNDRSIKFYELADRDYDFIKPKSREEYERLRSPGEDDDSNERHLYNVACGISGISERTLIEEAARLEASLVRHNTGLRGIVIRYAKALILTLWTAALIMFVIAIAKPLLEDGGVARQYGVPYAVPLGAVFSIAFLIWSFVSTRFVKHPLYWISEMTDVKHTRTAIVDHDPQFKQFESHVRWSSRIAWTCCLVSFASSVWFLVQARIV
jgi:hypothetical protein